MKSLVFEGQLWVDSVNRVIVAMDGLRWAISNIEAYERWCAWRRIRYVNFGCYGSE